MSDRGGAQRRILSGAETLVRLLALRQELDAREGLTTATLASGYPGSPLGSFDRALEAEAKLRDSHRIVHRPGVNEELALAAVWGSQMGKAVPYAAGIDGVAGVWYGKAPGLDRSGDVLRHANAMGSGPNGGVVLFCGDDPLSKSSTLASDSQLAFADACVPVLYPADQQELIDLGIHAFALSRFAGPIVALKIVTSVADGIASVDLDLDRLPTPLLPEVQVDGRPWSHSPQATIGPHQIPDQELLITHSRLVAAKAYVRANGLDRTIGAGRRLGLVCAGKTFHDVVQTLADLGCSTDDLNAAGLSIFKLAMSWPIVEETALDFAAGVDRLLVVEEKRPFMETQLRAILHERGVMTPILGKRDGDGKALLSGVGELGPADIAAALTHVLPDLAGHAPVPVPGPARALALPPRPPAYCSGCPHNRSTVVPEGSLAGGGVGCHGIFYFEPRQHGVTKLPPPPMGAEGVPWIGLAPFVDLPHLLQNLGDGTLSHSGLLAIRASVAAGVNVTYKILYNGAVAMTGGQPVAGLLDLPALTRELEAEGVQRITVCAEDPSRYGAGARWAPGVTVEGRDALPAVQEALRHVPGVTAIIYDQRCATEARRLRKRGLLDTPARQVWINPAVCEGCGDCGVKSNCSAVQPLATEFGDKRRIDALNCNRDYSCLEGDCPSFVTIEARAGAANDRPARHVALPEGTLPVPALAPIERRFGIYFTGIGGTGVVTANRILAAAAEAAGLAVSGVDQTGLSQKGGAVISHLQIAHDPGDLGAAPVGREGADIYLSGDIFQAAAPVHLARLKPGRSVAVVEADATPTAAMLQTGQAGPPLRELCEEIGGRAGQALFIDAKDMADHVFGDPVLANIVMLGAAFQLGGLPFGLDAIEAAIAQQGSAGPRNRAAFDWGRWFVHDRDAVAAALAKAAAANAWRDPFEPSDAALSAVRVLAARHAWPDALSDMVIRRAAQAIDYQDARLAARYLDLVARTLDHDDAGHDWALTRAVAEGWHRLLTYKDEYEVARLHAATDYDAVARSLGIAGDYSLRYHLHPQLFRRFGRTKKVALGRPFALAFALLRRMKGLRGGALDPFGRDGDRRLERSVIEEYRALIEAVLGGAYDHALAIAQSVAMVRGYGPVKERNVRDWRRHVATLIDAASEQFTPAVSDTGR